MANMTWIEAIRTVLRASDEPMHYSDIAQAVLDRQYRADVGATPAATVAAMLSQLPLRGEVQRVERGVYRLVGAGAGDSRVASPSIGQETASDIGADDMSGAGLINAFGISWRRSEVNWDTGNVRLLGSELTGSEQIDFGPQAGVYLLYDGPRLAYVGQAAEGRLGSRLWDHTRDRLSARWDRFSWFGLRPVGEDGALGKSPVDSGSLKLLLSTLEALLIEALEPPQNRRQGDGFKGLEFIQQVDPNIARLRKKQLLAELQVGL